MTTGFTVMETDLLDGVDCARSPLTFGSQDGESAEDNTNYRLPNHIRPLHYQLEICPNLRDPFDFKGSVVIELDIWEQTNNITVNVVDLEILSVRLSKAKDQLESEKEDKENESKNKRRNIRGANDELFQTDNEMSQDGDQILQDGNLFAHYFMQYFRDIVKQIKSTPTKDNRNEFEKKIKIKSDNEEDINITNSQIDAYSQKMSFFTDRLLLSGEKYKLEISFQGLLSEDLMGFYKMRYQDRDGNDRWGVVTQFQVSEARRTFPCFDEPSFKANFTVQICRELNTTTLSNMPKLETIKREGENEKVWDVYETSFPMSTYLVAFAVVDFASSTCSEKPVPVKVWVPWAKLPDTNFTCEVAPKILKYFETFFGISYPLPKLDIVGLDQFFAYGMENWGLITLTIDRAAIGEPIGNLSPRRNSLETISHEIAHQWFGNLVTPGWWSDIWLNEGFASYLSILSADAILPQWDKMKEDLIIVQQSVMVKDSLKSTHPIVFNVSSPEEYFSIFDEISYGKGCFIIRMIAHVLTESTFQKGLRNFLQTFKYKSATKEDLWNSLTKTGQEDGNLPKYLRISEVMDSWLYQKGYPLVIVSRLFNGSGIASQKRCFYETIDLLNEIITRNEHPKWWIPLSFTAKSTANMSETKPKYWLRSDTEHILLSDMPPRTEWFLVNMQRTGFYRVSYDEHNWKLLVQQLLEDHLVFDDITRSQMLDDAFTLAFSEQLDYEIPLRMFEYLRKESSIHVIRTAMDNISPLLESFSHDGLYGDFKDLIMSNIANHIPSPCFSSHHGSLPFDKDTKIRLAEKFAYIHLPCIKEAQNIFDSWKEHPANYSVVDKDLLGTMFCIVVREGGEDEWNILWRELSSNRYPDMEEYIIGALSCTRYRWLLSKLLLKFSLELDLEDLNVDRFVVGLGAVASNPIGIDMTWNFIQETWQQILKSPYADIFLEAVILHITSKTHYKEAVELIHDAFQTTFGGDVKWNYLAEVIKNVKRKLDFYERNYRKFLNFFQDREKRKQNTYTWRQRLNSKYQKTK